MNFWPLSKFVKCVILVGFFVPVCDGGDTCSAKYQGVVITKYCDIGGCCVPSTGNENTDPDELCCITTLTVILIASFVGGPIIILLLVCSGVCIKRYCEKKNDADRAQAIESERQERRRERRRLRQQQDQEEEAIRVRRYFNPKPEDGPMGPPAYDECPPGSVPGNLPMSPPPAYDAIVQNSTLPTPRQVPERHSERVHEQSNGHIDVTIHAPTIGSRRPTRRVTSNKQTVKNISPAPTETVHKNQVSPSNSFRTAPLPDRGHSAVPSDHENPQQRPTQSRAFSRPLQVVTDAPADEPADLLYI